MKNLDKRNQIIEHSLKLNSTNLSPLRSGNISLRAEQDNIQGYLITPSGKKYETLKPEDIVFMGLNEEAENNDIENKPSSEWRFHRDIPIEERNSEELSHVEGLDEKGNVKKIQIYPKKSKAMNLAFDVTPAKYVTGLITEKGICEASERGLKKLFK